VQNISIFALKFMQKRLKFGLKLWQKCIWKESEERKVLLLRGARQVGKSRSVAKLAENFEHFIEVNFEKNSEYGIRTSLENFSFYNGIKVYPLYAVGVV